MLGAGVVGAAGLAAWLRNLRSEPQSPVAIPAPAPKPQPAQPVQTKPVEPVMQQDILKQSYEFRRLFEWGYDELGAEALFGPGQKMNVTTLEMAIAILESRMKDGDQKKSDYPALSANQMQLGTAGTVFVLAFLSEDPRVKNILFHKVDLTKWPDYGEIYKEAAAANLNKRLLKEKSAGGKLLADWMRKDELFKQKMLLLNIYFEGQKFAKRKNSPKKVLVPSFDSVPALVDFHMNHWLPGEVIMAREYATLYLHWTVLNLNSKGLMEKQDAAAKEMQSFRPLWKLYEHFYSTVTVLLKFLGLSTSVPFCNAT